jgi:hypothetical protein
LEKFDIKTVTVIQFMVGILVSFLFQFIIPYSWQPLHLYTNGIYAHHGDPESNLVIFTVSQWYFSFSIAWFIDRENKILNNFLVYSIAPLLTVIIPEFFVYLLYIDYIHLFPFLVGIYILWKKRETVEQSHYLPNFLFVSIWLFVVYFLRLAYFQATLIDFTVNWLLLSLLGFLFFLLIRFLKKRVDVKN